MCSLRECNKPALSVIPQNYCFYLHKFLQLEYLGKWTAEVCYISHSLTLFISSHVIKSRKSCLPNTSCCWQLSVKHDNGDCAIVSPIVCSECCDCATLSVMHTVYHIYAVRGQFEELVVCFPSNAISSVAFLN